MRHLIETTAWSNSEISETLDLAARMKGGARPPRNLTGKILTTLFLNPSLRTRVSFIRAMSELGGQTVSLDAGKDTWKLAIGEGVVMNRDEVEHIREAIPVLGRYSDFLGIRAFGGMKDWETDSADTMIRTCAELSSVPLINLESAMAHPCQALADMLTIREHVRTDPPKVVLTWTYHPKAVPMAVSNSFLLLAARMGWDLTLVHPEGFGLSPKITSQVSLLSKESGGKFTETDDREKALAGAHVVYAKSWGSIAGYGDPDGEKKRKETLTDWIVDAKAMARTRDAVFMHCLPVRRNVEVTDEVIDSKVSKVVDQAENRMHAQKAILCQLARWNEKGSR